MGEIFANPLTELAEYGDMKQDLMKGKGPVQICGVTDSQKVHVMYQVSEEKAWRLVAVSYTHLLYIPGSRFCGRTFSRLRFQRFR